VLVAKRGTTATKGTKVAQRARRSFASLESTSSFPETAPDKFIPPHGGYQNLLSYQKALIVMMPRSVSAAVSSASLIALASR
jgi:hypothetical protein